MTSPSQIPPPPPAIPPEPPSGPRIAERPRYGSVVLGLVILAVGLWYFADRTLSLELPRLDADQLWPIAVIGLGAWLIVRSRR